MDGRLMWIKLTLSDWLFRAVESQEVKSIDPAYFDLGKPLERRLYEIGKKHIGNKTNFEISLEKLYKKSGTMSTKRKINDNFCFFALYEDYESFQLQSHPSL